MVHVINIYQNIISLVKLNHDSFFKTKNKKIKINQLLLILFIIFVIPISAFAQPGFDDDVADTPINGGTILLTVASIAFGVKKVINKSYLEKVYLLDTALTSVVQ
jgi:hypothetical protein